MKNVISISSQEKKRVDLTDFLNEFGAIIGDELIIHQYHSVVPIRINQIARVSFYKRQNFFFNMLSFCIAMICVYVIYNVEMTLIFLLILTTTFGCAMVLTFEMNLMEYTLLVVRSNLISTELKVRRSLKGDAVELVRVVNERLDSVCKKEMKEKLLCEGF